jgi:kinesin family protein 2/24
MGTSDGSVPGLYLLAAYDVIQLLEQYEDLEVWLSFYEIYCGKLYDLLNNKEMVTCREDAKQHVNIVGLTEKKVTDVEEIMQFIQTGL